MKQNDVSGLLFRRQFLLTPSPVNPGGNFRSVRISDQYILNYQVDLPFVTLHNDKRSLFVLGNLFDPYNRTATNEDIVRGLLNFSFGELLAATDDFAGRYLVIYRDSDHLCLFHDFMSHFKVYRAISGGKSWCGSQPHVLADLLNIKPGSDPERQKYFESGDFQKSDYTDLLKYTRFEGIEHLQPNHYLDLNNNETRRYWPSESIGKGEKDDIATTCATLIRGYINNASHRYRLMIPVTAGFDSRLLLAASKDVAPKCLYYIIRFPSLRDSSADIKIPRRVLSALNLDFSVLEFPPRVDEAFREVYLKNNSSPNLQRLPSIYNIFYKQYGSFLNVPANGAEAMLYRWWNGFHNSVDAGEIMKILRMDENPFAYKAFSEWLEESATTAKKYNIDLSNLFYIEYRMANWATQYQVNKDIAQDEFFPFNSRKVISLLLSLDSHLRQVNSRIIMIEMMKSLWEETLSQPFNPSLRNKVKDMLERVRLFGFFQKMRK